MSRPLRAKVGGRWVPVRLTGREQTMSKAAAHRRARTLGLPLRAVKPGRWLEVVVLIEGTKRPTTTGYRMVHESEVRDGR